MSLYTYILKRIFSSAIIVLGVLIITFFLTRTLPGDPVVMRLPERYTEEDYLAEWRRLGLNRPIYIQFLIFIKDIFSGNWGFSYYLIRNSQVKDLIMQRLPRSLEIMFITMSIAIILGMKLGKIAGANEHSKKDNVLRIFLYSFVSIPTFIIIIFMMLLYATTPFKIFPMFGIKTDYYPNPPVITNFPLIDSFISGNWYLFFDYLWHLVVPISAMVLIQTVIIMRQTRASMIVIMEKDFIRTARAKGLTEKLIRNKYAFKNAAPAGIIASGMGFATILGGMVVVEKLYLIPGLGWLFFDAIIYLDYPVIIAITFIFSLVSITFNFISDVIIAMIDPRIKVK